MVFLAVVHTIGVLPESEMKETKMFDTLPTELTYPQTTPKLCAEAAKKAYLLFGFVRRSPRHHRI